MTDQFRKIDELLKNARKILVVSHEYPDADATASVLALHNFFRKQKLESLPYLPDYPPKNLNFLPGFFEIRTEISSFEPDVLFCLDYGTFKRLRLPDAISQNRSLPIVTIDHHMEGGQRGEIKILEPNFSSTSEIIYHWLKYKDFPIDKEIATCLLAGIIADSGGFRHVSTSAQTLNIVSELLLKGVSLSKIIRQTLAFDKPLNLSRAWGQVLSRAKLDEKTGLAYSWVTSQDCRKFGIALVDFDGITNLISTISPQNLGLFLIEYEEGKIKGSLRSEPYQGRDVVKIAKSLGGGGHSYAAGFSQEGTIEEVLKKTINLIE